MRAIIDPCRRDWLIAGLSAGVAGLSAGCSGLSPLGPQVQTPTASTHAASTTAVSATGSRPLQTQGATDPALALHLLNRFAYGPREGDLERVMRMGAQAWIDSQIEPAQLDTPQPLRGQLAERSLLTQPHAPTLARFARLQADVLSSRLSQDEREAARQQLTRLVQQVQGEAREGRVLRAVYSERQLEEVLVEFWFNHFNVFAGKESVRATAGFFESEAIRPHVFGRFRDLLGATARHPAMLNYLDNASSVRPGFRIPASVPLPDGFLPPQGLNENYARELLELHTLGVDGGYTQGDVTELARIFTGWSFDRRNPGPSEAFRFYPARHDDAPKRLLGRDVPGRGQQQGEWALDLLAAHPATARHVARKLAVAFVADVPPPALIERLAATFRSTGGNLRDVMRTLARSPEFLSAESYGAKFKTPYRYVVSAARASGLTVSSPRVLVGAVARMGMPIYLCPTPDGWRDLREAWLSPESLRQRVEFSAGLAAALRRDRSTAADGAAQGSSFQRVALRAPEAAQPLPDAVLAQLTAPTRTLLADLPASDRLAIALASPDFMRR